MTTAKKMGRPPRAGGAKKQMSLKVAPPIRDYVIAQSDATGWSYSAVAGAYIEEGIKAAQEQGLDIGALIKLQIARRARAAKVGRQKSKTEAKDGT